MFRRNALIGVALSLFLVATGGAAAGPARIWVAATGALNGYAMDDINEDIASIDDLFGVEEISNGFSFGASAGVDFDRFTAALAYERLLGAAGDPDMIHYDLAADVFIARGSYFFRSTSGTRIGVGVGAGVATASGEFGDYGPTAVPLARHAPSPTPDAGQAVILGRVVEVSGTNPYFEGFVQSDTHLGERWSLAPAIGYRVAKIEGTWAGSEGSIDGTTDFSGWLARASVKFAFK